MSTESRPLAKVLLFTARDDAPRRPFSGDSRVLRFQTKAMIGWCRFKQKCWEHNRRQAELAARAAERNDVR